jgi:molybdopterin-guanine dinucleotide biosynthesis protein B
MHELVSEREPTLADIIARFAPCDLILVEGYKREGHKKIETRRTEGRSGERLTTGDPSIVAIASDYPILDEKVPVHELDDIAALADLIERETELSR